MKNWIAQITHEPLRHWLRFIKGFCIFMIGVALWYSDMGLLHLGVSDGALSNYSAPSKIISIVFLVIGSTMAFIGYLQILVCRLMPSNIRPTNTQ